MEYPTIHLLSLCYGELPSWIDKFIERINSQDVSLKCTCLGDVELESKDNFNFVRLSARDLCERVSKLVDVCCKKSTSVAFSDFRPAFGDLFSDIIQDCDWWGWCDLNVVFGQLSNFVFPSTLTEYDVITISPIFLSRSLTLLKNTQKVNLTYKTASFRDSMLRQGYTGFDKIDFSAIARERLACCFPIGWEKYGCESAAPLLEGNQLYSNKNEILAYNFYPSNCWPL